MQAFSLGAQFARKSAMLKLSEERSKWGESTLPLSFFRPRTYRKGYYFYSPQSYTVIKSKMVATIISNTNRFRPSCDQNGYLKIRLDTLCLLHNAILYSTLCEFKKWGNQSKRQLCKEKRWIQGLTPKYSD